MNYSAGDDEKAERLVKINMELFSSSKIKKIITPCSSCAFMLGRYESIVSGGEGVSEKVYTITELILEHIETKLIERPGALHIPCHIRNSKENYIYERLKRLKDKNVRIIDRCCGYGGVFNLYNYEKSIRIGEGLLKDIEGFDRVYTICSGCFLQIYDIIQRNNMDVYVCSIFELL
jgi:glycolate oxidase iron-sulfur subunit